MPDAIPGHHGPMVRSVVLVEGRSDEAALLALAAKQRQRLDGISVTVMGGATNVVRFVVEAVASGVRVAGLYDRGAEVHVAKALVAAGLVEGDRLASLERFPAPEGPTVIIANTVKGKGVPAVEGLARAHYTSLTDDEAKEALAALEVA